MNFIDIDNYLFISNANFIDALTEFNNSVIDSNFDVYWVAWGKVVEQSQKNLGKKLFKFLYRHFQDRIEYVHFLLMHSVVGNIHKWEK